MTDEEPTVKVEVKLPERILVEMASEGHTPSSLIARLVTEGWKRTKDGADIAERPRVTEAWAEEAYFVFMDRLLAEGEDYKLAEGYSHGFEEVVDPLSLLLAYWKLGSRPRSEELMDSLRFAPGEEWHTFLRTAKLRLTVRARRVGRPSLFDQPYGLGTSRIHPLKPDIYVWLEKWVASKTEELADEELRETTDEDLPPRLRIFEFPPPRPGSFPTLL